MEILSAIIQLLGGLAMFLYGIELMGDGLKNSSSAILKRVLEKVTGNVPGVEKAEVNLLAGKMVAEVENEAACDLICRAVIEAGYGASVDDGKKKAEQPKALYVRVIRPDTQEVFHLDGLFVYGTPAA